MELEPYKTVIRLFNSLGDKCKPLNERILLLKDCKHVGYSDESAEEWVDQLGVKAT